MPEHDNNSNAQGTGDKAGKCPICEAVVPGDSPTYPFCSKRCKTIDLGKWLKEEYTITRPIESRDLEEGID